MKEIIGNDNLERIGTVYDEEEIQSIVFALKLYSNQVRAGNFSLENIEPEKVEEALNSIDGMVEDFDKGCRTVFPEASTLIGSVILPFTIRIHEGISTEHYVGVCDYLDVEPFQLFKSALIGRQIVDGRRTESEYIDWQQ
jgi:hypothetical protein